MLLRPLGSALSRQARAVFLAPLGRMGCLSTCPLPRAGGLAWRLGHGIQSLWLLTLTKVRHSLCVTNNYFSPLLEKQDDKIQARKTGTRWFGGHPQLQMDWSQTQTKVRS